MKAYLSASSAKTFDQCPRKWFFGRNRTTSPETAATQRGRRLHSLAEATIKAGKFATPTNWPKEGVADIEAAVRMATGYYPRPHSIIALEQEVKGYIEDVPYFGFCDLAYHDDMFGLVISDHKSSSSKRYLLTAEKLRYDLQMSIYARHYMRQLGRGRCQVEHIQYILPKEGKPSVARIRAVMTLEMAEKTAAQLIPIWRDMRRIEDAFSDDDWLMIDGKATGCHMYGGCEFGHICGVRTGFRRV